jgi:hypothetical protein
MKFIKRLEHTAHECKDAIIGWDIFRCADYSTIDSAGSDEFNKINIGGLRPIYGRTIIFALNLGKLKFFKRWFLSK